LAAQYLRPYLGYGDIQYYNYDANSSYHSLQVTVNRPPGEEGARRRSVDVVENDGL